VNDDYLTYPIDERSRDVLAEGGLRMAVVDHADRDAYESWLRAEARGFHDEELTEQGAEALVTGLRDRRPTGVWDDTIAEPELPVATVDSWVVPLTVPGRTSVDSWAISGVTVAPTHRRRGIARALVEAELRTARRLGVPVAILTVSESTLYGRYGFDAAAFTADWSVDTRRVSWIGRAATGRIQFVSPPSLREEAPQIFERARLNSPGEMPVGAVTWDHIFGLSPRRAADERKKVRCVRFDDADGVAQGFAVYKLTEDESDFSAHVLDVGYLTAATDDAYAGLWRYLFELDLVARVRATVRSTSEPFVWQLSDYRAARKTAENDHLWLRILDVREALEARAYGAPGRFVLDIDDPLGFCQGRHLLSVAPDGSAVVEPDDDSRTESPEVFRLTMGVRELSALYLGGVRATDLIRAGRIREHQDGAAAALDLAFHSTRVPWQSIWF
jgi:predicted acetyltransferase